MNKTIKIIVAGVAVLVVGFILGTLATYKAPVSPVLGGVNYDQYNMAGGMSVGINGTSISKILSGSCNLVGVGGDAIAGGAAKQATCSATGVVSGDRVFVTLPYVSGSKVVLAGATASTTAGSINVNLYNASSTVASAVTTVGTSTKYYVVR